MTRACPMATALRGAANTPEGQQSIFIRGPFISGKSHAHEVTESREGDEDGEDSSSGVLSKNLLEKESRNERSSSSDLLEGNGRNCRSEEQQWGQK